MDGCARSRSPRRSTLLGGGTLLAVDGGGAAVVTGASEVDCKGKGADNTAGADSNGWKSLPLGLHTPKNTLCTTGIQNIETHRTRQTQ